MFPFLCPAWQLLYKNFTTSSHYQRQLKPYHGLFAYLEKNTGWKFRTLLDVAKLYFGLTTTKEYGLKLPEWSDKIYPWPLNKLVAGYYSEFAPNAKMMKYASGIYL